MRVELDDAGEEKRKITVEVREGKVRIEVREKDKVKAEATAELDELKHALGMLTGAPEPKGPTEEPAEE